MRMDVKKIISGVMNARGVLVLFILATVFIVGCTKQNDGPRSEQPIKNEDSTDDTAQGNNTTEEIGTEDENGTSTATADLTADITDNTDQVINNGGLYVSYKGNVYYRQYTSDSYNSVGLFGTYETIVGAKKNMMRLKPDGTSEIAFNDIGEGNIFICKDRMYLEKLNKDLIPIVYAVDLDGSNEQEIGTGWVKGIDEESGTLVCVLADAEDTYQLHRLDGATGVIKKYDLKVTCSEFLALKDGVIYYSGEVEFEASKLGEIKLCSVNLDGSNEKLLVLTDSDLYELGDRGTVIPCIQFVGDTIYFSYGAYGGTGNYYQSGKIAKVEKDGRDFTVILGDAKGTDINNNLVDDIFYVASDTGKEILYYSQTSENKKNFALDLSTGEVNKTDFPIYAEGKPFEYEGGISIYQNASPKMTTWIPSVDYGLLDLDKEADYYTIKDIELCDNWVYYRIEANEAAPEVSIGWRDGYRRVKTKVVRQELDGDTVEILFEY